MSKSLIKEMQDKIIANMLACREHMKIVDALRSGIYRHRMYYDDSNDKVNDALSTIREFFYAMYMHNSQKYLLLNTRNKEIYPEAKKLLVDIFGDDSKKIADYLTGYGQTSMFNEIKTDMLAKELDELIVGDNNGEI